MASGRGQRGLPAWEQPDWLDWFTPQEPVPESRDPLRWPGYPAALQAMRSKTGHPQAVTAGLAAIGGCECVLVSFDFAFLGGSMGGAEGELVVAAIDQARRCRVPMVSYVRSGGARMQEGMHSLVQMRRITSHLAELASEGLAHVCAAAGPTTGGVWASLAAGADYLIAQRGAQIGFAGSRTRSAAGDTWAYQAEAKWRTGFIDCLVEPAQLAGELARALRMLTVPVSAGQPAPLPRELAVGEPAAGWSQVQRARDPSRPRADAYLRDYFDDTIEIRGDRCGGVDPGLRAGFGRHCGRTVAYVAQLGVPTTPAGFRTASRLIRLADRLRVPVLTLVDCPGAASDPDSEAAGVGTAIAGLFEATATSKRQLRSVVVGEGGSGGALALTSEDNWMSSASYFSVIAPELAAAILKQPASRTAELADLLQVGPVELVAAGYARGLLPATASA